MKVGSSGIGRRLRWLIVLLCLGGAVFAAEKNWVTTLRVGHVLTDLLAQLTSNTTTSGDLELPVAPAQKVETVPINGWLQTALFYRPASAWTLDPMKAASTSPLQARASVAPAVATFTLSLPTAYFSAGYVSYSPETIMTGPVPTAPTASGTWTANASGNWSDSGNWSGGTVADGAGNIANIDTVNISTDVTVTLDTSRTIGELNVGDTNGTHHYTIAASGGSSLTFDNVSNRAILRQSSTSAGDTVSVPILLNSDLDINNLSGAHQFTISGNITPTGGPSAFPILRLNNVNTSVDTAGNILVSGNIANGPNGAVLSVDMVAGGTVTFTGTNTYTGSTSVNGGTLLINGNNSGATGTTFVSGGGSVLGGTGTIGSNNVQTFDGTITGATTTTVGTLTLLGNVDLSTGEGDGTYLANLSGTLSDLLAITGTLSLGAGSILDIDGVGDGITTYTLATFASRDDVFGSVLDIPGGYALVYHSTDIQLVPIPEPATWIGGALTLGVIAFVSRRRLLSRFARHA